MMESPSLSSRNSEQNKPVAQNRKQGRTQTTRLKQKSDLLPPITRMQLNGVLCSTDFVYRAVLALL